jgi:hypothetical protein
MQTNTLKTTLALTLFAVVSVITGRLSAFGSSVPGSVRAANAVAQRTTSIPFDQIDSVAAELYSGDGLSIIAASDGARLRCVLQRLDGEATRDGLWLTSTMADQTKDRFRVKAVAVGEKALPDQGSVSVEEQTVRFCRAGLVEEYSVSMDGVRQDFVVLERPAGQGRLTVQVEVTGAEVEATSRSARFVLERSGRRISYHRLRVTDDTGRELPAEMKAHPQFSVVVEDADAVYPVRIDPTFTDENWIPMGGISGVNGWVLAAVMDASGNLYVGGSFTVAGNTLASNIAKWDGINWSTLGSGFNGPVTALAVLGNDVYAGGEFTMAGGVAATRVAKWNGANWTALGAGINGSVSALAVVGDEVYAGGGFTSAGGNPATNIAKWTGSGWVALGSGMNNTVLALAVSGTELYAGGRFTVAGGVVAFRTAKWNGSFWSALGDGMNSTVRALAFVGSELYAGGDFWQADYNVANRIAKWNGTSWSALNWGIGTSTFDGTSVHALTVLGTNLYAGGYFQEAGGVPARCFARWNGSNWSALGAGIGVGGGDDSYVIALAASGTNVFVGGNFVKAGGLSGNGVARWEATTPSWRSLGVGVVAPVRALAVSSTDVYAAGTFVTQLGYSVDNIVRWNGQNWVGLAPGIKVGAVYGIAASGSNVYVAGAFTNAGITPASYIAKWNGVSWSALGSGLNGFGTAVAVSGSNVYVAGQFTAAGGIPANRIAKWDGSNWSALGSGLNGWVHALAVSDNDVYAGGEFTSYVAKWNGTNWIALGDGVNNYVRAIAISGSNVYVGGDFSSAGAVSALGVARWNGSSWSAVGNQLVSPIYALAASGNDLYAGGWHSPLSWSNYVARWNGTNWTPLGSGIGGAYNPRVFALAATSDSVYVGGDFLTAGGKLSAFVARANLGEAQATLLDALDNTNFIWSTSGAAGWFGQTNVTHDGVDAAQSGPVGRGQISTLSTIVTGPGTLSFWWKASSAGAYYNYLRFYLDGNLQTIYSANSTNHNWWQPVFYLGAGVHSLNWEFQNYDTVTGGNAGWVDQVSFVPGGTAPEGNVIYDRVPAWIGGQATFQAWAEGTPPFAYQLVRDGVVVVSGTNSTVTLTNVQASDTVSEIWLRITNDFGKITIPDLSIYLTPIAAWGNNASEQCRTPEGLSNVVQVAAGAYHSLALQADGTVVAWGDNWSGLTDVPEGLNNVKAVACSPLHNLALQSNGTVVAWGNYFDGANWVPVAVPGGLSNVMAVAAGYFHSLALQSNGAVVAWDLDGAIQADIPEGLSNVVVVACGDWHSLSLQSNGTVVAWGDNGVGQTDVPASLSGVMALAAGAGHSLALRSNGTVVAWGSHDDGTDWVPVSVPEELSNVVAIAAGGSQSLALRADGTVVGWGFHWNSSGDERVPIMVPAGLQNVIGMAVGADHSLALISSRLAIWQQPIDRVVALGANVTISVGTSGEAPLAYQWYFNTNMPMPNATNASLTISNAQFTSAGMYFVVITNAYGSVTSSFARLTVVSAPGLALSQGAGGLPQIGFTGTAGTFCDIEKSTNLVNWNYVGRAVVGQMLNLDQLDPGWRTSPRGFYRVALAGTQQHLPPTITKQPLAVFAPPGGAASFTVGATGSLPLQFQWCFNSANIGGATNTTLYLTNVHTAQMGFYSVVITGPGGSTASFAAPLYVQSGEFPSGDDFNDGVSDPARWGFAFPGDDSFPMLTETNGHLEFIGTGEAAQMWIGSQGSYTQDWEVLVGVNLPNLILTQDWDYISQLMLIGHDDDEAAWEDTMSLSFDLSLEPPMNQHRYLGARAVANGEETGWNALATLSTQAIFRVTFSAANKTLTAWVDEDGSANGVAWTELLSQRVDSQGADWGMSASSRFVMGLGAFAGGHIVNPGDGVFFDNFITSGGFEPPALIKLADYYPLPLGAEWIYEGFDWDGNSASAIRRVDATNTSITIHTGRSPAIAYTTNCVSEYNAYADSTTMIPYDEWTSYMAAGNRFGYFGDTGAGDIRLDGGAILPEFMTVGSSFTNEVDAYVGGTFVGSVTLIVQLLGKNSVILPAGSFTDVVRVRITIETPEDTETHDEWWAKGVGRIKEQGVSGDGEQEWWELIEYSIPTPTPAPVIHSADGTLGVVSNKFGFTISGQFGQVVVVESSTNLLNWLPLQTNTLGQSPVYFSDLNSAGMPRRFYRAVGVP